MPVAPLWKKLTVAFAVGFGGVLIPALLTLLDKVSAGTPTDFSKSFWIALVSGAFAAGLRALLALSPWNFIPSDAANTLGRKKNSV